MLPTMQGSGRHEPQLMAISHGAGLVFHSTLGHDLHALSSAGFIVTFQRGTEWAATGQVSRKLPGNFPSPAAVSVRPFGDPWTPKAAWG